MKAKKKFSLFRGWLPKDITMQTNKPDLRWRKPRWIALALVGVIAIAFVAYSVVQTCLRWSNPQLDVTASYFEKTLNSTSVHVGDSVQVTFRVVGMGMYFQSLRVT